METNSLARRTNKTKAVKQHTEVQSPPSSDAASGLDLSNDLVRSPENILALQRLIGNHAVQRMLNPPPPPTKGSQAVATGAQGTPTQVPFRQQMEASFGADFSQVDAHVGQGGALAPIHAKAAAQANTVVFADANPDPSVVAHELTHVLQNRQAGVSGMQGMSDVSSPDSAAEREADINATSFIDGLPIRVLAPPSGQVMLKGEYALAGPGDQAIVDKAVIQEKQEAFELALGAWLEKHPLALQGANLLVQGIHNLLNDYVKELGVDYQQTVRETFGTEAPQGMPGAVKNSFNSLIKAMNTGNLRQKMTMVYNSISGGMLPEMLDKARAYIKNPPVQRGAQVRSYRKLNRGYIAGGAVDNRMAQADARSTDPAQQAQNRRYAFFERSAMVQQRSQDRGLRSDRSAQAVNQKEQQTVSQMEASGRAPLDYRELKTQFGAPTVKTTQPVQWQGMTQQEKKAALVAEHQNDPVPWNIGYGNYEITVGTQLTQEANALGVRLLAGVSGSTDMYMHVAKYLNITGQGLELVRLATLGEMLSRKDHSFFEIMRAAEQYGLPYNPGNLGYHSIPPLTETDIRAGVNVPFPDDRGLGTRSPKQMDRLTIDLGTARVRFQTFLTNATGAYRLGVAASAAMLLQEWDTQLINEATNWMIDPQISALIPQIKAYLPMLPFIGVYAVSDKTRKAQVDAKFAENPNPRALNGVPALVTTAVQFKDWLAAVWVKESGVAVQSERVIQPFIDMGIPRHLLEKASNDTVNLLNDLKVWLENGANLLNNANYKMLWQWIKDSGLPNGYLVLATMIRHTRGDAQLAAVGEDVLLADAAKLMTANVDVDRTSPATNVKILSPVDIRALPQPPLVGATDDVFGAAQDRRKQNLNTTTTKSKLRQYLRLNPTKLEEVKQEILDGIRAERPDEFALYQGRAVELTTQEFLNEMIDGGIENTKHTQFIKNMSNPFDALEPRERGGIFQYTTTMYGALNNSINDQETGDYTAEAVKARAQDSGGVASLKFTMPILKATTSGLEKLPVYTGEGWRGATSGDHLSQKSIRERQAWADRNGLKVGAIESYSQSLSSSKRIEACYLQKKNEADYGFRIINLKTGRDVELLSNSEEEEEVLFPPGSRFVITAVDPDYAVGSLRKVLITMSEL